MKTKIKISLDEKGLKKAIADFAVQLLYTDVLNPTDVTIESIGLDGCDFSFTLSEED